MTIWKHYHLVQSSEDTHNALVRAQGEARQPGRLARDDDLPGGDRPPNKTGIDISDSRGEVSVE
jgi:hypothetical protein